MTYPLTYAKTVAAATGNRTPLGVLLDAVRKGGVKGVYRGLEGQLLKGFLSEGLKMTIKDRYVLSFSPLNLKGENLADKRQVGAHSRVGS